MAKLFAGTRVPTPRDCQACAEAVAQRLAHPETGLLPTASAEAEQALRSSLQKYLKTVWQMEKNEDRDQSWLSITERPEPPAPPAIQHDAPLRWNTRGESKTKTRKKTAQPIVLHMQRRALYEMVGASMATMIIANINHEWMQRLWAGEGLLHRLALDELDATFTAQPGAQASLRWLAMATLLSHEAQKNTWQHRAYLESPLHRIAANWHRPSALPLWDLLVARLRMGGYADADSLNRLVRSPNFLGLNIIQLWNQRAAMLERLTGDNRLTERETAERIRVQRAWSGRFKELWYVVNGTPLAGVPGSPAPTGLLTLEEE